MLHCPYQILAKALSQLPSLCKLDLSNNCLSASGGEALATALMARNRNAYGAAAENRIAVHLHGNPFPEELHQRIMSLSVPVSMTHAAERLPPLPDYGPPRPRSEMSALDAAAALHAGHSGSVTGGSSGGSGGGAPPRLAATVLGGKSMARRRAAALPAPPSLVPSPALLHAPLPRTQAVQVPFKAPRCATAISRSAKSLKAGEGAGSSGANGNENGNGGLASRPPFLTAPPPPPSAGGNGRRSSFVSKGPYADATAAAAGAGGNGTARGSDAEAAAADTDRSNAGAPSQNATALERIYGVSLGQAPAKRNGTAAPNSRPGTSSGPYPLRPIPGPVLGVRPGSPGAPYAAAVVAHQHAHPHSHVPQHTGAHAAHRTSGNGGSAPGSAQSTTHLPAVKRSNSGSGQKAEQQAAAGTEGGRMRMEADAPDAADAPAVPKVAGASAHLTQKLKCHTPDWVQRMQEVRCRRSTPVLLQGWQENKKSCGVTTSSLTFTVREPRGIA